MTFATRTSFASQATGVDNVGPNIDIWGTSSFLVTLTFLIYVKWSGLRTSSTANHIFWRSREDFMVHDVNNPYGR